MAERQHEVRSKDAGGRVRVHFAGTEADARKHVENNFPRPHVEPGSLSDRLRADVHLLSPDGSVEEYHGDAGWVDIDSEDNVVDNGEDED